MFDSPEIEFATAAVREAALLVREIQRELISGTLTKEDRSPVTVADFAAQAVVARRLAERFPSQVLVGEENAAELHKPESQALVEQIAQFVGRRIPEANRAHVCEWIDRGSADPGEAFWTLDPIDGTKGFLRGDQYAVALGKIVNGRVELGVLGCPELSGIAGSSGALVVAVRSQGTWAGPLVESGDWQPLKVSQHAKPAEARLLRSVESAHTNTGQIGRLVEQLGVTAPPVPMDSQAKYAVLAAGGGDMLVRMISASRPDYREKIWDQAAGSLVVEEAGGRVTDLDGKSLDFSHGRTLAANRGVLATNGHLHEAALSAIRAIGA